MAYSDKVLDHYENPRNVGKMDEKCRYRDGWFCLGDVMRLQIRLMMTGC